MKRVLLNLVLMILPLCAVAQSKMAFNEFKTRYSEQFAKLSKCVWVLNEYPPVSTKFSFYRGNKLIEQVYIGSEAEKDDYAIYEIESVEVSGKTYVFHAVSMNYYQLTGDILKVKIKINTTEKYLEFSSSVGPKFFKLEE